MYKVFVLEERTHIVSELQWQFEGESDWQICKFTAESTLFRKILEEGPAELVVIIDMAIGKAVCLQFLQRCLKAHVAFPVVVFSQEPLFNLEWALRELGVFHIQTGRFEPDRLAKICRWNLEGDLSREGSRQRKTGSTG